mmetsp:Transcript_32030/g.83842  ORF Transcript_32030/g.83842 Transcript_32030/m.83842 type:complete len:396 (+) Transcript_32030:152-1339(+)
MIIISLVVITFGLPECDWCTGGECNPTCSVVKDEFEVSISPLVGGRTMPYWRASAGTPLGTHDAQITIGIIIHHGAARNGDDYACSMYNGVLKRFGSEKHGANQVLLASPQIYEQSDGPSSSELYWDATGSADRNWKWGGNSTASLSASISSFSVLDEMIGVMMNSTLYPNLKKVLVAGHSAGGQIVQRYALASAADPVPGTSLAYFPANPSSYTYISEDRPVLDAPWTCEGFCSNQTIVNQTWSFALPDAATVSKCPGFDTYGYGLSGELPSYLAARGVDAMRQAFGRRIVTYLSGSSDVCDQPFQTEHACTPGCDPYDGGLDTSCEAYLQGNCRMMRAHAFVQHIRLAYAPQPLAHRLVTIPNVGHNGCAVFQAEATLAAMFPAGMEWQSTDI